MRLGLSFQHGGSEALGRAELTQGWQGGRRAAALGAMPCLAGSISPCLLLDTLKWIEVPFDVPFELLLSLPSRPQAILLDFVIKLEGGAEGEKFFELIVNEQNLIILLLPFWIYPVILFTS